jgi:hypothetical protein
MSFLTEKTNIRTLRPDDPLFRIQGSLVSAQRAGFEVSSQCPSSYRSVVLECIERGWLRPVAYMTEQEYLLTALGKE